MPEKKHTLSIHIVLMTVLVILEAAVLLVLFTDNTWIKRLPGTNSVVVAVLIFMDHPMLVTKTLFENKINK